MEVAEEAMDIGHSDLGHIVKGKRTKRYRQSPAPTTASSSSDERLLSSPETSSSTGDFGDSTEEDEDMANCLILLAQSGRRDGLGLNSVGPSEAVAVPRPNIESRRVTDLYECKTCNKCFPSFQALGGHRASHKKPKAAAEERERLVAEEEGGGLGLFKEGNMAMVLVQPQGVQGGAKAGGGKGKVHECSICGSEFTSGQALGGHMRRHRIVQESPESKKAKNAFTLDLNLPAPDDSDVPDFTKFQSGSDFTRKPPVLFAALVDCHN